ncbi:Uncharacterised protein [uncultured archaeon]|nr:Uncharacterised protein [uncultured archaeon]
MHSMQPSDKDILSAILTSDWMKEEKTEWNADAELKDSLKERNYCQRLMEYKSDKLQEFFDQPVEDMIKIDAVWKRLSKELKSDYDGLWDEKKAVLEASQNAKDYLIGERRICDIIEEIRHEVTIEYRRQLEAEWKGLTLPETIKKLKELNLPPLIYAVMQDVQGVTTSEPYPVVGEVNTKVTGVFAVEKSTRGPDLYRLELVLDPPITHRFMVSIEKYQEEPLSKMSLLVKKEDKKFEFVTV